MSEQRVPSRPTGALRGVLASLSAGALIGAYLWAWWWGNDRDACRRGSDLGTCWDSALAVLVLGTASLLVALWLTLRLGGARSPALGMTAVLGGCWLLALLTGPLGPPLSLWPFVAAVVTGLYLRTEGVILDRR